MGEKVLAGRDKMGPLFKVHSYTVFLTANSILPLLNKVE